LEISYLDSATPVIPFPSPLRRGLGRGREGGLGF